MTVLPISAGAVGEVAADRGEVERRHGVDEAFEAAVLQLVPHRVVAERLFVEQFLRVVHVEAPEVDELRGGIDLGLERRLRLSEHGRRVDRVAPGRGQQLGGLEDHGGAILEGPAGPLGARGCGRLDRLLHVLLGAL